jgi:hypothetical protein
VLILVYARRDPIAAFRSDPNQIRPWEHAAKSWDAVHTVDPSLDPLDPRFNMGYSVSSLNETAPGKWEGEVYVANPDPERYDGDYELIRMESQTEINGKPVRFEMTGQSVFSRETIVGDFDPDEDWYKFSLGLYHPDGRAFDPEILTQWFEPNQLRYFDQTVLNRGRFYGFSTLLTYPEDEGVLLGPRAVFDPRTRVILDSTGGGRRGENALYSGIQLPVLTGDHVMIAQELFHGPVTTNVLPDPGIGDELTGAAFRAQLIFLGPGEPGNYGHSGGKGERRIRFGGHRRRDTHANFGFVFTPPNAHHRMEILAVDAVGNTAPLRHRSSSFGEVRMQVEMPRDEIRELRFHYRTSAKRLLIEVPLFAIPPDNREVSDLFDVRIPLVVIRSEQHWREVVAELVQLRTWRSAAPDGIPEDRFPIVFENTTPRELLVEYRKLRPEVDIRIHHREFDLIFDDGSGNRVMELLEVWFQRVRRYLPL